MPCISSQEELPIEHWESMPSSIVPGSQGCEGTHLYCFTTPVSGKQQAHLCPSPPLCAFLRPLLFHDAFHRFPLLSAMSVPSSHGVSKQELASGLASEAAFPWSCPMTASVLIQWTLILSLPQNGNMDGNGTRCWSSLSTSQTEDQLPVTRIRGWSCRLGHRESSVGP